MDVDKLTELLREAEEHHGQYEPTAPKHRLVGLVRRRTSSPASREHTDEAVTAQRSTSRVLP